MALPAALLEWSADEASGDVLDVSGNGRNLTLTGNNLARVAGHTGAGLQATTTGTVLGPDPAALQTPAWSFVAWVRITAGFTGWLVEFYRAADDTGVRGLLNLSGTFRFRVKNAAGSPTDITIATDAPNWHHVGVTFDGTTLRVYRDGPLLNSAAVSGGLWAADVFRVFDAVGTAATLDDVRFYSSVLTPAQVSEAMSTPVGAPPSAEAHSGSLALSGSGALALSGAAAFSGILVAAGSGSSALAATPATSGTRAADGSGALTATAAPSVAGTRAADGSGALTASGSPAPTTSYGFSGSGGFGTASDVDLPADLPASGSGALAASGLLAVSGTLAMSGSGSLTAAPYVEPSFVDLALSASLADGRWSASPTDTRWSAAMDPNPWTGAVES